MVLIVILARGQKEHPQGRESETPRPSPLSSPPLPTSEPQFPQLSPEGTRAARYDPVSCFLPLSLSTPKPRLPSPCKKKKKNLKKVSKSMQSTP